MNTTIAVLWVATLPLLMIPVAILWASWVGTSPRYAHRWLRWSQLSVASGLVVSSLNLAVMLGWAMWTEQQLPIELDARWAAFEQTALTHAASLTAAATETVQALEHQRLRAGELERDIRARYRVK